MSTQTRAHHAGFFLPTARKRRAIMAKLAQELSEVVTVKVPKSMMEKLDRLSVELCRSRADTIRRLIAGATVTGQPDLTATLKGGHDAA